jgi:hypothetical protein
MVNVLVVERDRISLQVPEEDPDPHGTERDECDEGPPWREPDFQVARSFAKSIDWSWIGGGSSRMSPMGPMSGQDSTCSVERGT